MQIHRSAGRQGKDKVERFGCGGGLGGSLMKGEMGCGREGWGVYHCLKGSGGCVQINKQEVIAEGLYIYFLS